MKRRRPRRNVLLDTNVWRYIADLDAGDELLRKALQHNVRVQIAPSVLYEALRTEDSLLRKRLVALMTRSSWMRLMPEAYEESQEILREVQRLRPDWLRSKPDRERLKRLRYDWVRPKGGFWDRARFTPDAEAARLRGVERDMVDRARLECQEARESALLAPWTFDTVRLDQITSRRSQPLPGWDGDDVEPWRFSALSAVSAALGSLHGHPYIEWLSSEVNLYYAVSSAVSWTRFWLYEVDVKNAPRYWLRWAFETLQSLRRTTSGTPCDTQLGTYLTESDHFVSSDRTLIQVMEKCRRSCPVNIATTSIIPGGSRAVSNLFDVLAETGHAHQLARGRTKRLPRATFPKR